ncbi:hypothetical protein [Maribacter sp.]
MMTTKEQTSKSKNINDRTTNLVQKFYNLRMAFEADYSGKLRSHKYEETRAFTISLNYGIFQANRLVSQESVSAQHLNELQLKLNLLKSEFSSLRA